VKPQNLDKEIDEVIERGLLPSAVADDLDAVRIVGNFGAHPGKGTELIDAEPQEAEWNLDVLEELFEEFYVKPAKRGERRTALNKNVMRAYERVRRIALALRRSTSDSATANPASSFGIGGRSATSTMTTMGMVAYRSGVLLRRASKRRWSPQHLIASSRRLRQRVVCSPTGWACTSTSSATAMSTGRR
jgi:hypothetical protein